MSISPENLNTPPAIRLRQILASFSSSSTETIEPRNSSQSPISTSELVEFLNTISDSVEEDPENAQIENTAFQVLSEIHTYISSTSIDQDVMDAISFELPKAVARFSSGSKRCIDVCESIIDRFIATCSPRDMLSILCEALDCEVAMCNSCRYYAIIFSGLAKVLTTIERRHFEQVKVVVPGVLKILKSISTEADYEDADVEDLFSKTIGIASSIYTICVKLEGKDNEKIRALFGPTILQIMASTSVCLGHVISRCFPLVLQLFQYLQYCQLPYLNLIAGAGVDKLTSIVLQGMDGEEDFMICFSNVNLGAALVVVWGQMSSEAPLAAEMDLAKLKDELKNHQTERWQAVGLLRHIFLCVNLSWIIKKHAIQFLLDIMKGIVPNSRHDEHEYNSVCMLNLCASLQAVQMVIMYASDRVIRKMAFDSFKMVLMDVPARQRFDILVSLIKHSDSSSMIAILLDCLRGEMHKESRQTVANGIGVPEVKYLESQNNVFWSVQTLELVEFILKPPQGGPPILPENSDAALSALNLYRYILITESTGKTNYTGALYKENLRKSYKEWLLPLRVLVRSIAAESEADHNHDHVDSEALCALNPVELVLHRCIELIEECMK
ncbi:aberrant root formation protein 4 [Apium graveolens]|uniref:aberrant root formation protein 4 n=1 Tax=Apium graveolens TaxID=4045 RepID=UPI003D79038F